MRYLGIDFGLKRTGIAISDAQGKIAFPYSVIMFRNFKTFLTELKKIVQQENISTVVIGLPLGMDQQDTQQTRITREAVQHIKTTLAVPVVLENEILTSQLAERTNPSGDKNDAAAAALILQSFLDRIE